MLSLSLALALALQVRDVIMQDATARKWDCTHLRTLKRDAQVQEVLSNSMRANTLDLQEIEVRCHAQLTVMKMPGRRPAHKRRKSSSRNYRQRRTSSAPANFSFNDINLADMRRSRSTKVMTRLNEEPEHPFDYNTDSPKDPPRPKSLQHTPSHHRRTQTTQDRRRRGAMDMSAEDFPEEAYINV